MADKENALQKWQSIQCKLSRLFVHDLKNPISAIAANLSFLEASPLEDSEETRGAISDSVLAANMLLRLADNFDMIAVLESGERGSMSQVNVVDFMQSAIRRNKFLASSAGVRFTFEKPETSIWQYWQNRYADLVIDNLLMSAVRHSPQGGEVLVSCKAGDNELCISVHDHGQPIAQEQVEDLFTRAGQVEAKKRPGSRYGRGLGLYAVGLAVNALDGRIKVSGRDGMTGFTVVVPLNELPDDE